MEIIETNFAEAYMLYLNARSGEGAAETGIPSNQMKNGKLSANCIISSTAEKKLNENAA